MCWGFPGGSDGKESACSAGDLGLILGSGRSPGEGHGNPLQCSCLENPMDRGAWRATVHGVTKSRTDWVTNTHHMCSSWERESKLCTSPPDFNLRTFPSKQWGRTPQLEIHRDSHTSGTEARGYKAPTSSLEYEPLLLENFSCSQLTG